jgi:hypothetical protein
MFEPLFIGVCFQFRFKPWQFRGTPTFLSWRCMKRAKGNSSGSGALLRKFCLNHRFSMPERMCPGCYCSNEEILFHTAGGADGKQASDDQDRLLATRKGRKRQKRKYLKSPGW